MTDNTDPQGRDVLVYAYDNGAILVVRDGRRESLVTAAEAVAVARGVHTEGGRVLVQHEPSPLAEAVIDSIVAADVPVVGVALPEPPRTWADDTTALMEAASSGVDHLLDDMLARGVAVDALDVSGSSALHHAAANGNGHAVEALVGAGADIDRVNERGFTPHMLAVACREHAVADQLASLGADVAAPDGDPVTFSRSHLGTIVVWIILPVVFTAVILGFLWPPTVLTGGLLVAGLVAYGVLVLPPRAFFAGGAPRRLVGTELELRRLTGRATVDLAGVEIADAGGATDARAYRGARWLVLGHPDGHPVDRRTLDWLGVAPDAVDTFLERSDRVVVVALAGGDHESPILAIGNVLSSRGVDLSESLRQQLARARKSAGG